MTEKMQGTAWRKKSQGHLFLDLAFKHLNKKTPFGLWGGRMWFPWLQDKDRLKYEGILMNKDIALFWFSWLFVAEKTHSPIQGWQRAQRKSVKESESRGLDYRNKACWVTGVSFCSFCIKMCFKKWLASTSVRCELSKNFCVCKLTSVNEINTFNKGSCCQIICNNETHLTFCGQLDTVQCARCTLVQHVLHMRVLSLYFHSGMEVKWSFQADIKSHAEWHFTDTTPRGRGRLTSPSL